jgi:hypothetical protein
LISSWSWKLPSQLRASLPATPSEGVGVGVGDWSGVGVGVGVGDWSGVGVGVGLGVEVGVGVGVGD